MEPVLNIFTPLVQPRNERPEYLYFQRQRQLSKLKQKLTEKKLFFIKLEQKGIPYFDPTIHSDLYHQKACAYQQKFASYSKEAYFLIKEVDTLAPVPIQVRQACFDLKCRLIGLRYSLGKINGGLNPLERADPDILNTVSEKANQWKKLRKFAPQTEFNWIQQQKLKEMARYPKWVETIQEEPHYLKEVFKWCLKDNNSVEVIVKCFETCRLLRNALLSSSMGYVSSEGQELLVFISQQDKISKIARRVLTLPFYHGRFETFEADQQKRINILNPNQLIHFRQGNYQLTVKEFFNQMSKKNLEEPNINLCGHWGFVNFHAVKGIWHALEKEYKMPTMQEDQWISAIPAARLMTHEKINQKYSEKLIDQQFFFKVMTARRYLGLVGLECHAYLQLYTKMNEKEWKVVNVGTYAHRYQQNFIDGIWLLCATVKRVFSFSDPNAPYTHRQQAAYPVFLHPEQNQLLLRNLYQFSKNEGPFQLLGYNCAQTIQKLLRKSQIEMPELFAMPLAAVPSGISAFDRLLQRIHTHEKKTQRFVLNLLHGCCLSSRKLVIQKNERKKKEYSVKRSLSKNSIIYNPAYLADQIEKGKLPGEIYWCHSEQ